jgi:hypothetical protein
MVDTLLEANQAAHHARATTTGAWLLTTSPHTQLNSYVSRTEQFLVVQF